MPTYAAPGVTVSSLGAQSALQSFGSGSVFMLVGTAPQGPDYPVLVNPGAMINTFGDYGSSTSLGYTIPLAQYFIGQQSSPVQTRSITYLVCRVGVTRASVTLNDNAATPAPSIIIQGIGAYAGTRGNNLRVAVTATGLGASQTVANIAVTDNSSGATLINLSSTQYNLSTPQAIVATINGMNPQNAVASVIQASIATGGGVNNPANTVTPVAMTGGASTPGTAFNDPSVATALTNSLWTHADYIWAGWDGASIAPAIASHMSTAYAQNEYRRAYLGPQIGTYYTALSTAYASSIANSRISVVGYDSFTARNPITGSVSGYDGFYLGAIVGGVKALSPAWESCTRFPISGVMQLNQTGVTSLPYTPTQLDALGGAGNVVFRTSKATQSLTIRDMLTTLPVYGANSQINPFSQANCVEIDDMVANAIVQAVEPLLGRPSPTAGQFMGALHTLVSNSLDSLGAAINGINSLIISIDPVTQVPTIQVSYITRYPVTQIVVQTSYTFS